MKVSIITINYKTKETTARAIEKAREVLGEKLAEVILIDNNSGDGSADYFRNKFGEEKNFRLIFNEENLGFARAVNQGLEKAGGDYLLLLNSDVFLEKSFLKLLDYARKNPEAGILGPKMVYPDGGLQLSMGKRPGVLNEFFRLFWLYKILPWGTVTGYNFFTKNKFRNPGEVDWVSGGCFLIKKNLLREARLLDEKYFFGVEDMDYCYRAQLKGFKIIYYPKAKVIHYHGFSSGGKRSLFKLSLEKKGILDFYQKFFSKNKIGYKLIENMYNLKIYLVKKWEERKLGKVKDIVLALTFNCNARCKRCFIWKSGEKRELEAKDLEHLPSGLKDINLSGGEPFLARDFLNIISILKKKFPRASVVISTNGLAPGLIKQKMQEALKINPYLGVAVSLDGLGKVHDDLRGVEGAYERAEKTLEHLKELGVSKLKISFTLGDENIRELKKVYNFARDVGAEFSLTAVHSSENYFGTENDINLTEKMAREIDWVTRQELKSFNPKKWGRALYAHGLKEFLKTGKRIYPDYSGKYNLFVDPLGRVYPCDVSEKSIGSLGENGLNIDRSEADQACAKSWMVCTARPAIKKHWLRSIFWVLKNKIKLRFFRIICG